MYLIIEPSPLSLFETVALYVAHVVLPLAEIGDLYVAHIALELATWTRLASNSQGPAYLCLLSDSKPSQLDNQELLVSWRHLSGACG